MIAGLGYLLAHHQLTAMIVHLVVCTCLLTYWLISRSSGTWPRLSRWNQIPNLAVLHSAGYCLMGAGIAGVIWDAPWMLLVGITGFFVAALSGLALVIFAALSHHYPTKMERAGRRPAIVTMIVFIVYGALFIWSLGLASQPAWLTFALRYLPYGLLALLQITFLVVAWKTMGMRMPRPWPLWPQAYTVIDVSHVPMTQDLAFRLAQAVTWDRRGAKIAMLQNTHGQLVFLGAYNPDAVMAKAAEFGMIVFADIVYGEDKLPEKPSGWTYANGANDEARIFRALNDARLAVPTSVRDNGQVVEDGDIVFLDEDSVPSGIELSQQLTRILTEHGWQPVPGGFQRPAAATVGEQTAAPHDDRRAHNGTWIFSELILRS